MTSPDAVTCHALSHPPLHVVSEARTPLAPLVRDRRDKRAPDPWLARYADIVCDWERGEELEGIADRYGMPAIVVHAFIENWLSLVMGGEG